MAKAGGRLYRSNFPPLKFGLKGWALIGLGVSLIIFAFIYWDQLIHFSEFVSFGLYEFLSR